MSNLTTTNQHPLMGLPSPEDNYPDLVSEVAKKLCIDDTNHLYEKQANTSKNNLFFSERSPPDVANIDYHKSEQFSRKGNNHIGDVKLDKCSEKQIIDGPSLNKSNQKLVPLKFDLSIPLDSSVQTYRNEESIVSPDSLSISAIDNDKSLYQAFIDPYKGSVQLMQQSSQHLQSTPRSTAPKRKIKAITLTADTADEQGSLSGCSLDSEEIYDLPRDTEPEDYESNVQQLNGADESDEDRRASLSEYSEAIPEYSAAEERADERCWLKVALAKGDTRTVDMKVIEPYKRVLSHGGYSSNGAAVIVFSACHLPDCSRVDYDYVMDNLLFYILWTVERLVTDEYVLVYLHGSADSHRLPSFKWLRKSYYLIDRRLRKNLKHLYLVHPTLWLKSIMWMCKPFISSKFYRKVSYVNQLSEIMDQVPVEPAAIPDKVKKYDSTVR